MNVYILLGMHDEGVQDAMTTKAESLREAIIKFDLHPFTWPADWSEEPNATYEQAVDEVMDFYGEGGFKRGNYVDGDSNKEYRILEVLPNGTVKMYPEKFAWDDKVMLVIP